MPTAVVRVAVVTARTMSQGMRCDHAAFDVGFAASMSDAKKALGMNGGEEAGD